MKTTKLLPIIFGRVTESLNYKQRSIVQATEDHHKSTYDSLATAKRPKCFICGKVLFNHDNLLIHMENEHKRFINDKLRQNPQETYAQIFKNRTVKPSKTDSELRWDNGLKVDLRPGPHYGNWYDFKKESGGSPIKAIKEHFGVETFEALEIAIKILENTSIEATENNTNFPTDSEEMKKLEAEVQVMKQNKCQLAQDFWQKSVPLQGTLGQVYLSKRGISDSIHEKLNLKFLKLDKDNMILVPILDCQRNVQGVQRIYLTETGQKIAKMTLGNLKGNAGLIQDGSKGQVLVIAEGPETAASIATVFQGPILASLSLGNMKNMCGIIQSWQPKKVIIAADFDGEHFEATEESAIEKLSLDLNNAGIKVVIKRPEGFTKCDWNDVLVQKGIDEIRKEFS